MRSFPARAFFLGLSLAVLAGSGCSHGSRRPAEHASAGLLRSEASPKLTSRQAADVQMAMGRSLEEAGNAEEAAATYRKAIENDPKRADAHSRLGILMGMAARFDESNEQLALAVKCDPKNPEYHCDQGYAFYVQQRWADAEACLRKAIELDPVHARSHTNLGLVLARQGNQEAALAAFSRGGCTVADARSNLGLILAMDGNLSEAEATYRTALAATPDLKAARTGLDAVLAARSGGSKGSAGTVISDPSIQRTSANLQEKLAP